MFIIINFILIILMRANFYQEIFVEKFGKIGKIWKIWKKFRILNNILFLPIIPIPKGIYGHFIENLFKIVIILKAMS